MKHEYVYVYIYIYICCDYYSLYVHYCHILYQISYIHVSLKHRYRSFNPAGRTSTGAHESGGAINHVGWMKTSPHRHVEETVNGHFRNRLIGGTYQVEIPFFGAMQGGLPKYGPKYGTNVPPF